MSERPVGIAAITGVTGSRVVPNSEILNGRHHRGSSEADVVRRTGIEKRCWAGEDEDVLSLAVRACRAVLAERHLDIGDLDLIVCSTTTPACITPSLACQVLAALSDPSRPSSVPAYDMNAACSGYLYALQSAYDFLQSSPEGRALVVTSEVLSQRLNTADFDTAFLFGDAASATIIVGEKHFANAQASLRRPEVSAKGDRETALSVPLTSLPSGYISMSGTKIFTEAVRSMTAMLNRACAKAGIAMDQLSLVIPHQANQRILDAVGRRAGVAIYSNIRHLGNTSSSTIPLALREVLLNQRTDKKRDYLGLCAFGGGFTFGAAVLQVI